MNDAEARAVEREAASGDVLAAEVVEDHARRYVDATRLLDVAIGLLKRHGRCPSCRGNGRGGPYWTGGVACPRCFEVGSCSCCRECRGVGSPPDVAKFLAAVREDAT